jgi:hypothetical protein
MAEWFVPEDSTIVARHEVPGLEFGHFGELRGAE